MTELIYAFALLLVGALSFFLGLKLSDRYHDQAAYEQKIALQKQYVRLTAGMDADSPVQPYVYTPPRRRKFSVGESFVEHMRTNGSATIRVDKTDAV